MAIDIKAKNYTTTFKHLTKDLLLMEKHESLCGEKRVTDVFTNFWGIGHITEGRIKAIKINGTPVEVNCQGIVVVPPFALVEWHLSGKQTFSFQAIWSRVLWPQSVPQKLYHIYKENLSIQFEEQFKNLNDNFLDKDSRTIENDFLTTAYKVFKDGQSFCWDNQSIANLVKLKIDENASRPIGLEELCREFGYSKSYIIKLFKKQYAMTPGEYLKHLRIYASMYHMLFNKLNTTEAGFESGYENLGHYYRYFKNKIGVTPSKYKTRRKANEKN